MKAIGNNIIGMSDGIIMLLLLWGVTVVVIFGLIIWGIRSNLPYEGALKVSGIIILSLGVGATAFCSYFNRTKIDKRVCQANIELCLLNNRCPPELAGKLSSEIIAMS